MALLNEEEGYKITNVTDGMIDFKRNASDTSRHVFKAVLKEGKLCVGFSLLLYDPDHSIPDYERWAIAYYLPQAADFPKELLQGVMKVMRYLGEGMKAIWTGYIKEGKV